MPKNPQSLLEKRVAREFGLYIGNIQLINTLGYRIFLFGLILLLGFTIPFNYIAASIATIFTLLHACITSIPMFILLILLTGFFSWIQLRYFYSEENLFIRLLQINLNVWSIATLMNQLHLLASGDLPKISALFSIGMFGLYLLFLPVLIAVTITLMFLLSLSHQGKEALANRLYAPLLYAVLFGGFMLMVVFADYAKPIFSYYLTMQSQFATYLPYFGLGTSLCFQWIKRMYRKQ